MTNLADAAMRVLGPMVPGFSFRGWAPLSTLAETTQPYREDNDIAFFGTPARVVPVHLLAGDFVIFFPQDGHAPGVASAGPTEVRKVVIKIRATAVTA